MRCTKYAMALAADISYNQRMFWGKRDYWFQPLCEQLGWDIKDHFKERFRIVFFVVCCDLVQDSTNHLKKDLEQQRGSNESSESVLRCVPDCKGTEKVKFSSTLKLFETLFPKVLA